MPLRGSRSTPQFLEKEVTKALPFQSRPTFNVTDWLVRVPKEQLTTHQIPLLVVSFEAA